MIALWQPIACTGSTASEVTVTTDVTGATIATPVVVRTNVATGWDHEPALPMSPKVDTMPKVRVRPGRAAVETTRAEERRELLRRQREHARRNR